MTRDELTAIRTRLDAVKHPNRKWKFNPQHGMFIGHTNAIEMYDRVLDLGRDYKEWAPYQDETGKGYRLTEASKTNLQNNAALGVFLESCREDMRALIEEVERLRAECIKR